MLAAACSSPDDVATSDESTPAATQATVAETQAATDTLTAGGGDESVLTLPSSGGSDPGAQTSGPVDGSDPGSTAPADVPLPTTSEQLAAALSEAELALRAPETDEVSARPWGRRQQVLYRVLSANPTWADDVLATVDPAVVDAVGHNWAARQDLSALVNSETLHDELPAWRIAPPAPADELLGYYREAAEATGVPWEILAAINLVETRMGRISGVSTAGALGPMQFLPTTWAECCDGDPTDNHDAIRGAAEYLIDRGAARDLDRAVFGYNNSDRYVRSVRAYAAVMEADPDAYYGYHAWQVFFLSTEGLVLLPEGYEQSEPLPIADWLADHPESLHNLATAQS